MLQSLVGELSPLGLLAIITALCGTAVMLAFSVKYPHESGPQFWAPASMLALVSMTMLVIRSPLEEPVVAICGSAGFVLGYLLLWAGYLCFFGRRPPWLAGLAIVAAYMVALIWSVAVMPHPGLRIGVTMLTIAAVTAMICYSLLRHMQADLLQSQAMTALLFGLLAVGSLARGLLGIGGKLPGNDFTNGPLGYGLYLVTATVWLLIAACTGLMLVQRQRRRFSAPASDAAPRPPGPASPSAAGDRPLR